MKYFIAILILIIPMATRAAQICASGYYKPSPDSECQLCPKAHYCPNDDNDDAFPCPADNTDWNKLLEGCGYHPLTNVISTTLAAFSAKSPDPYLGSWVISQCEVTNFSLAFKEGRWHLEQFYNSENNNYWHGCDGLKYFYSANPGYYLSRYYGTSYEIWYSHIKPCTNEHPAHSHYSGPGTPDDPVKGGKTDYNDCPWACDDGYGRHNDECLPLCTAGATKFHVGDYVFNIYKDKLTTPAINIQLGDGSVCYVPLVTGSGKGALNVDYHGIVYHTSN